jgi:hypothetical protein
MKVSKMVLGKTVENEKNETTQKCRILKTLLCKNVENENSTFLTILLSIVKKNLIHEQKWRIISNVVESVEN